MNTTRDLVEQLKQLSGKASFASFVYTEKKRGETARYTVLLNTDYRKQVEASKLELELRAKNAQGIEATVIADMIASLNESLAAMDEGREHVDYTKAGQYLSLGFGLKLNLNDNTLEISGLRTAKVVLQEGEPFKPVKHRTPETALKAQLRRELPVGRFRTWAIDEGHFHAVKLNGETLVFE